MLQVVLGCVALVFELARRTLAVVGQVVRRDELKADAALCNTDDSDVISFLSTVGAFRDPGANQKCRIAVYAEQVDTLVWLQPPAGGAAALHRGGIQQACAVDGAHHRQAEPATCTSPCRTCQKPRGRAARWLRWRKRGPA